MYERLPFAPTALATSFPPVGRGNPMPKVSMPTTMPMEHTATNKASFISFRCRDCGWPRLSAEIRRRPPRFMVSRENRSGACRRNCQIGAAEKIQKTHQKQFDTADPPAQLPMNPKDRPNRGINQSMFRVYEIEVKSLIPPEDRKRQGVEIQKITMGDQVLSKHKSQWCQATVRVLRAFPCSPMLPNIHQICSWPLLPRRS